MFKKQKPLDLEAACRKESTGRQRGLKAEALEIPNAHSNGRTATSSSVTMASNGHRKGKGPIRTQVRHHILDTITTHNRRVVYNLS